MQPMNDFDWYALDARLLRLLVAVAQTGSVTAAAQRLGVTQSAVSHQLDRLRAIVGDPLFVKSGRGIVATARTEALLEPAQALLEQMERFARRERFEPALWEGSVTVAANDLQRDLLLPPLLQRLQHLAPQGAAARDSVGHPELGAAAPASVPARAQPASARWHRHRAKAPV